MANESYKFLKIIQTSPNSRVFNLVLDRPSHRNAFSGDFFTEFPRALSSLDQNPDVAVIVLSGAGPSFCSGIDFSYLGSNFSARPVSDRGRLGEKLRRDIKFLQDAITAVELCRKPVIVGVHGACVGGGIDLITACDVRYCSGDAYFAVKEVDLAITADLGTLQRLPGIVGYGAAMELSLTGRRFSASEAKEMGLVTKVFSTKEDMEKGVQAIAEEIAGKSPLAVTGTKAVLLRSRDLSVEQGLDYVATWNSAQLLSHDLEEAVKANAQKRKPLFAKL